MKSEELKQRVDQVEGFIRALTQECHILDERRHILAPLLQNSEIQQALKKKLDKTPGVGAWNHLAPLLGQDLLRDQARLFLDDDSRSGSLTNLWRKLRVDPAIKDHFREVYGRMFDDLRTDTIEGLSPESSAAIMEQFAQQDRDKNYARFDEDWERVEAEMAVLGSNPVAAKIKTFRNKRHAHFEMQKLDEEPKPFDADSIGLTFDEVLAFGDLGQALVAKLGLLLTGTSWDPQEFAQAHAKQGTDMWKTLAN
ncbi:hypothetical protein [Pseudoxanthomonas sacheonensis]|uniref:AbiU2 domain-containing protein n=1 Tax=Pseudoxanthomonas sacheonensis TaxID=443615 RepID=UPI0013D7A5CA|nr:hypothetical protein [Pseudoxanthomonas sacheonensis]KAF1710182.1 hypothetical protein CSC73_05770 [Pseudoxanthomonas sacheonensis]